MPKITIQDISRGYAKRPSIAKLLPWRDVLEDKKVILLENDQSLGVCFDIQPIACEARPPETMEAIMHSIAEALKNAIPLEKENPWVLQAFVRRVNKLDDTFILIKDYIKSHEHDNLTKAHLKTLEQHLHYITQPGGIFFDQQVTNTFFRGGHLAIRLYLYRRIRREKNKKLPTKEICLAEVLQVSRKLADQLRACGLDVRRLGKEFYFDMLHWFNPKPEMTQGDTDVLIQSVGFPSDDQKPFGWDFAEQLFFKAPESFEEGWLFDNLPHKILTIQNLTKTPEIGHTTGERKRLVDDKVFTLIDHLPENSVLSINIVFQALSETEFHLKKVFDSAVGREAQPVKVREEVNLAANEIAHGNLLFPTVMALYLQGNDLSDLKEKEAYAEVLLNSNGFKVITDDELFPVDAYLRYLPMTYDYAFDKKHSYRSRYLFLQDIAKLLPFYGRSTGTEHPGMLMYNRGGEPWLYDVLADKTKNAHFLLLGETGTGKSNLLCFLVMQMLAIYNPRIFIVEAGGSFDLLGDYCQSFNLSVNKVKIDPRQPISLNPFAQGLKVLDQLEALNAYQQEQYIKLTEKKLDDSLETKKDKHTQGDTDQDEDERDILGDMVLAALTMITGGEKKEEDRISRADRMLIMDTIILAARTVREAGKVQMIASDIIEAFEALATTLDATRDHDKIKRAREMADSMRYFAKDPVSSKFFNAHGEPWPLADVTIVDFGLFAQEGYEAQRSIAFAGCVNKILALADANQYSNRPIITIFDENHLFSKLPLLAQIQTRIAKMGRKLGLWLWLATQNLKDFADESRKMLSLIETWMCLALPPDEVDQIERFKILTPEQRALFLSARKEKGKYTEGVLLSPRLQSLFRNVPPRLYLAMAATDQDEKNHRKTLMQQHGFSEIEAVKYIADQMMQQKPKEVMDD